MHFISVVDENAAIYFCCKVLWEKVPQEVFIGVGLTVCLIDVALITLPEIVQ